MNPNKKFFTGMAGVVGGVCLGAGIGLSIVPLLSVGLIIVIVSVGLLVTPTIKSVQSHIKHRINDIQIAI